MKSIKDIITESNLDNEAKIKNEVCIELINKVLNRDEKLVENLSSKDNDKTWIISLKPGVLDLNRLHFIMSEFDGYSKYNCIKSIKFEYDTKKIIIE